MGTSDSYNLNANASYTEPLTLNSQLTFDYRYSYNYSDKDKKTYQWEESLNAFNPSFDDELSNVYNSGYTTHRVGPGYKYGKDGTTLVANLSYQRSSLDNAQTIPVVDSPNSNYNFNNITYFGLLKIPFDKSNTLRLFMRSRTENPSITELQDVLDVSNIQSVSSGNPYLVPAYNHSLYLSYNRSNTTKGQTFLFSFGGDVTQNSISDSTVVLLDKDDSFMLPSGVELAPFGEYNTYTNMDGKWSTWGMASFGTPLKFISSNLNIYAKANISSSPNIINGEENYTLSQYYSSGATIGSNISERVDFTVGYNGTYGLNKYSLESSTGDDSEYFTHKVSADIKATVWNGFTFTANAAYNFVNNISIAEREEYLIVNAFVGKKVFKSQLGEILFGVYDIFDQNTSYKNNLTNLYTESERNTTLGQYFSLKFIYSLRNFSGSADVSVNGKGMRGDIPPSGVHGGRF